MASSSAIVQSESEPDDDFKEIELTGPELIGLLSEALIKGAASAFSKRTMNGFLDWLSDQATARNSDLTEENRQYLKELAKDDSSLWKKLAAELQLSKRKGVCLIGPSGAGKTILFNWLTGRPYAYVSSTSKRKQSETRFRTRYFRVVDTPGSTRHVNLEEETYKWIRAGKIRILILVLSCGYLETAGAEPLARPGERPHKNLPGYLSAARAEEIDWLNEAAKYIPEIKRKIPYFMVVLNKLDLWIDRFEEMRGRYTDGSISDDISKIAELWCRTGVGPTFHPVSGTYDSFYGRPPAGEMSAEASKLSVDLLIAQIRLRLLEK